MITPVRSGLLLSLAVSLVAAAPVGSQTISYPPGPPSGTTGFLPRYEFFLDASHLDGDDRAFAWSAHFGGDLDLVDFGVGRVTARAAFETILGEEFREFDPNQGSYILDLSSSFRIRNTELAAVFHHVSRHLSDRPKPFPIDWNMLGVRLLQRVNAGALDLVVSGRALRTVKRSFVDYDAEIGGCAEVRVALGAAVSAVAKGGTYRMLVRPGSWRGHQDGSHVETGARIAGSKGAIEVYVGFERRVDAEPFDGEPRKWVTAGFRLLSR